MPAPTPDLCRPWAVGQQDHRGVLWDAVFDARGRLVALVDGAAAAAAIVRAVNAAAPDAAPPAGGQ